MLSTRTVGRVIMVSDQRGAFMDPQDFHRRRRRVWGVFEAAERERASRWHAETRHLPEDARAPGTYGSRPNTYEFCLPLSHSKLNLLPAVRDEVLRLFSDEGIAWHRGMDHGPTNHLVSSQVQCVNAMGHLIHDEDRLRRAFGGVLDLGTIVPIEQDRLVTFEYVGPVGFSGIEEGRRSRGAHTTSVDAAFLHDHPDRGLELVLVEWKYTERYGLRSTGEKATRGDTTRLRRYRPLLESPVSPVRSDVLPLSDLLQEPFYQLMRQQLLAAALEGRFEELGIPAPTSRVDRAVVVHVTPSANEAYRLSLSTPTQIAAGDSVGEVWNALLRDRDRFMGLSSDVFVDAAVTSQEYVERYGP